MRTSREMRDIRQMEPLPKRCKSCPFNPDGCIPIRAEVIARTHMGINQTCHSTRQSDGEDTHLCRGAREYQLDLFYRQGVIEAPTDEAWNQKRREVGL